MANEYFNFDEFLSEPSKSNSESNTNNTRTTINTSDTTNSDDGETLHPFSARLDERYTEIIRAVAWWHRISQREFIEQAIDALVEEEDLEQILKTYRAKQSR